MSTDEREHVPVLEKVAERLDVGRLLALGSVALWLLVLLVLTEPAALRLF